VTPEALAGALARRMADPAPRADPAIRGEMERRLDLLRAAAPALGPAAWEQLMRRLSAQVPGLVAGVAQAFAGHDAEALGRAAHQLKGAAANLGVRCLADCCDALEQVARSEDLESGSAAVAERALEAGEAVAADLATAAN
jgi:HPt (histidine-containing phosphotransfer) domain-containing protein